MFWRLRLEWKPEDTLYPSPGHSRGTHVIHLSREGTTPLAHHITPHTGVPASAWKALKRIKAKCLQKTCYFLLKLSFRGAFFPHCDWLGMLQKPRLRLLSSSWVPECCYPQVPSRSSCLCHLPSCLCWVRLLPSPTPWSQRPLLPQPRLGRASGVCGCRDSWLPAWHLGILHISHSTQQCCALHSGSAHLLGQRSCSSLPLWRATRTC